MSIASELTNLESNIGDAYDAVNDMSGIIPQHKNMANLDQAIRTIPQSQGATYTAGNGINIDANNEISIDDTVVAELSDLPGVMTGASSSVAGASGLVPAPAAGDDTKVLSGAGTWVNQPTVPTVNDATLTIQHNGTTVQTFTANQSTNATANIIVPTQFSDLSGTVGTSQIADDTVAWAKIAAATMPKAKIAELTATNGSFTATDRGVLIVNEQFQANVANTDCNAKISFSGASGATVTPRGAQRGAQYSRSHVFGLAFVAAGDAVTWTVTYNNAGLPSWGADSGFSLFIPCNW